MESSVVIVIPQPGIRSPCEQEFYDVRVPEQCRVMQRRFPTVVGRVGIGAVPKKETCGIQLPFNDHVMERCLSNPVAGAHDLRVNLENLLGGRQVGAQPLKEFLMHLMLAGHGPQCYPQL